MPVFLATYKKHPLTFQYSMSTPFYYFLLLTALITSDNCSITISNFSIFFSNLMNKYIVIAMGNPKFPINEPRSEEHTSELQSRGHLVCRLLLEKKNNAILTYLYK